MKRKRILLHICTILWTCVITGLLIAHIIAKPITLTNEEISYYANTAEKVWYEGLGCV